MILGNRSLWLGLAGLLAGFWPLPPRLCSRRKTLWKQRRYQDANEVFRQLVANNPKNPDYKVRWGRMYLEHSQPDDAADLFQEALELKDNHAGALLGMALIAADSFRRQSLPSWPRRRWNPIPSWSKPRNCWPASRSKTTTTPRPRKKPTKRYAWTRIPSTAAPILATMDWLADKKESAVGSARPPRLRDVRRASSL